VAAAGTFSGTFRRAAPITEWRRPVSLLPSRWWDVCRGRLHL